jgi:hypothetical protein
MSGIASFRSIPAQKHRSPAAVRMATQRSGSSLNVSNAVSSAPSISRVSEFIASGRLIVTTTTWSFFS